MTNINIPELMDDELLISYICRIAEENGMPADKFAMHYVHNLPSGMDPNERPIALSPGSTTFIPKLASVLGMQPLDLFMKTTLYPGTAPLTDPGKQIRIINSAFRNVYPYPRLMQDPQSDISRLRYCPVCAIEDRRNHGFSWLRRAHQMPGVGACWLHGVRLRDAIVNTRSSESYVKFPVVKAIPADHIEIDYAAFAGNFLNARFDFDAVTSVKLYVHYANSQNSWIREIPHDERDAKMEELNEFNYRARNYIGPKTRTIILTQLFTPFHNVNDIPPYEDTFIRDHFISQLAEYELVSGYHANGMTLRKRHDNVEFVTTAMGFLLGWREPSDDNPSEIEKYNSIIDNLNTIKKEAGLPPCEKTNDRLLQSIETNIISLYKRIAAKQVKGERDFMPYIDTKEYYRQSKEILDSWLEEAKQYNRSK